MTRRLMRVLAAGLVAACAGEAPSEVGEEDMRVVEQALLQGPPLARTRHSLVWDATGGRLILFGGIAGALRSDAWVLPLTDPVPAWAPLSSAGAPPSARREHSAIWDVANDRMIVFGGRDGSGLRNDVWALAFGTVGASWSQLTTAGPTPAGRTAHTAVWDAAARRMIVFGGAAGGSVNEVWSLDFTQSPPVWSQLSPPGPLPRVRQGHTAVWDAATSTMVVYGGYDWLGGALLSDVWALSFSGSAPTWTQLVPGGTSPGSSHLHTAVWDPSGKRMIAVGAYFSGIQELSFAAAAPVWAPVTLAGPEPSFNEKKAVWDAAGSRMILFGGSSDETWVLSFDGSGATGSSLGRMSCETAPPVPTLTPPSGGSTSCGGTLSWTVSGSVVDYTFSVLVNGQQVASGLTATTFQLPGTVPLSATGNTWQVKAAGCPGSETSSAVGTFGATSSPQAPTLTSPANNATGDCDASFQWTAGAPTASYDLLLGQVPPLSVAASNLAGTSHTLLANQRLANGTYLWQVRARDCTGATITSGLRTVVVDNTPPKAVLTAPALNAFTGTTPTLTWQDPSGSAASRFTVLVDGTPMATDLTTTSFTIPAAGALAHGPHTWAVRTTSCDGSVATSDADAFRVDARPPEPFALALPADGAWFNTTSIDFSWQAITDADSGLATRSFRFDATQTPVDRDSHRLFTRSDLITYDFDAPADLAAWTLNFPWRRDTYVGQWVLTPVRNASYTNGMDVSAYLDRDIEILATTVIRAPMTWCTERRYDSLSIEARVTGGAWERLFLGSGTGSNSYTEDGRTAWVASNAGKRARFRARFLSNASYVQSACTEGAAGAWLRSLSFKTVRPTLADGLYDWNVTATDRIGNAGTSETRKVGIDRIAPSTAPTYGAVLSISRRPAFTWTAASDALSGIGSYEVVVGTTTVATAAAPALTVTAGQDIAEGTNTYAVVARDKAGNVLSGSAQPIVIDVTAPNAPALTSPADGAVVASLTPDLCWGAATDNAGGSGLLRYELFVDDVKTGPDLAPGSSPICASAYAAEGRHTWKVVAYDKAGWSRSSVVRAFFTDTQPPAPFRKLSPADASVVPTRQPRLCWEAANDSGSGIVEYLVEVLDSQETVTSSARTGIAELCHRVVAPLVSGRHTWRVTARDGSGRTRVADAGTPWSFTVVPDVTAPACEFDDPPEDALHGPPFGFLGHADDSSEGSGVERVEVCFDTGCPATWTAATVEQSDPFRWRSYWAAPLDGRRSIGCRAIDREGNVQATPTYRRYTFDLTPPLPFGLRAPPENNWTQATPTFEWDATSDAWSEVSRYEFQSWPAAAAQAGAARMPLGLVTSHRPTQGLADGVWNWTIWACDLRDNCRQASEIRHVRVDTIPPQAPTLERCGISNRVGPAHYDVSWSTPGPPSELCDYVFRFDGSEASTDLGFSDTLAEGDHEMQVRAIDCAGNVGPWSEGCDTRIDRTPPATPLLLRPADGMAVATSNPMFEWAMPADAPAATPSGICGLAIAIDGVRRELAASTTAYSPGDPLSEGPHEWSVRAVDCAGNESPPSEARTLVVDTIPPGAVGGLSPAPDAWLAEARPDVTWTASGDIGTGVAGYLLTPDRGEAVRLGADQGAWKPENALSDGVHCVFVAALDRAGNVGLGVEACFGIDTTPPVPPTSRGPRDGECLREAQPLLTWDGESDVPSGVARIELLLDASPVIATDPQVGQHQASEPFGEGVHTWRLAAVDRAGNRAEGAAVSFLVDTSAPTCRIVRVEAGTDAFRVIGDTDATGCGAIDRAELVVGTESVGTIAPQPDGSWMVSWHAPVGTAELSCAVTDSFGRSGVDRASVSVGACFTIGECRNGMCSSVATGGACDDGDACTAKDACQDDGRCVGQSGACEPPPGDDSKVAGGCGCQGPGGLGLGWLSAMLLFWRRIGRRRERSSRAQR